MGLISWLIMGAIVGWLAGKLTDDRHGLLGNILVGILGAFVGGTIFARGNINNSPLTISSFCVSLLGAVILLALLRLVRGRR